MSDTASNRPPRRTTPLPVDATSAACAAPHDDDWTPILLRLPSAVLVHALSFLPMSFAFTRATLVHSTLRDCITQHVSGAAFGGHWTSSAAVFVRSFPDADESVALFDSLRANTRRLTLTGRGCGEAALSLISADTLPRITSLRLLGGDFGFRDVADANALLPQAVAESNIHNELDENDDDDDDDDDNPSDIPHPLTRWLRDLPSALTALDLSHSRLGASVAHLHLPQSLRSLDLSHCALGRDVAHLPRIHPLSQLERVCLCGNSFGAAVAFLPAFPASLHSLCLAENRLDARLGGYQIPDHVQCVCLHDNLIAGELIQLDLPVSLRTLCLSANPLGAHIHRIALPAALERLELAACDLGRDQHAIERLKLPPTLRSLSLAHNPGAFDLASACAKFAWPPALQHLCLAGCFQNSGALLSGHVWAALRFPPRLTHLDLTNNQIGSSCAKMAPWPATLTWLSLSRCNIGAFSGKLPAWPHKLAFLTLAHNALNMFGGGLAIGNSVPLVPIELRPLPASLRCLDVSFNELCAGVAQLRLPPQLGVLFVDRDDVAALRATAAWSPTTCGGVASEIACGVDAHPGAYSAHHGGALARALKSTCVVCAWHTAPDDARDALQRWRV